MYISSFPAKYPHTFLNPTPSFSHIYSTRALIGNLLQFVYVAPLPPGTGEIPERIIILPIIFSSFPTNSLHFCIILVVPSMSSLIVSLFYVVAMPQFVLYPFSHIFYPRSRETNNDIVFLTLYLLIFCKM